MKKQAYHHGNLRADLLKLTAQMIADEGLDSVTMRELAFRLGISRTAPYRHFEDKNTLLATVAEGKFQQLNLALLQAFDQPGEPMDQLKAMARIYIDFAVENYDIYRLMFSDELKKPESYPGLAEAADETFAILAQSVMRCQESAVIEQGDPTWPAYAAWSTLHGVAELYMEGKLVLSDNKEQFFAFICDTMAAGLAK
ncbi:MAG: TetR/AcrR family transcriptional regulator [Acidobacteriota bacterium]|nr:TetR/AcrR family transcriptional regulator [Acidobacteriota bacterium]